MKKLITFFVIISFNIFLLSACVKPFEKQGQNPSPTPEFNPEVLGEADIDTIKAPSIDLKEGQSLYVLDLIKSEVSWTARKVVGVEHTGAVDLAAGRIITQDEKSIQAIFVLDMLSLSDKSLQDDQNEILENHLKSEDFFAVEQYPLAELIITSAKFQENSNYELTGSLTIKDITKEINFPAKISLADEVINAEAEFSINRTLWDIRYGSDKFFDNLANNAIEDKIDFSIKIIAEK